MAFRLYVDQKTNQPVIAKPSDSQPGIIVYYKAKNGKPTGRCMAATVEEFNEKFKIAG
jgi:hypothetical protein